MIFPTDSQKNIHNTLLINTLQNEFSMCSYTGSQIIPSSVCRKTTRRRPRLSFGSSLGCIHNPGSAGQPAIVERGNNIIGAAEKTQYSGLCIACIADIMWLHDRDKCDGSRCSDSAFRSDCHLNSAVEDKQQFFSTVGMRAEAIAGFQFKVNGRRMLRAVRAQHRESGFAALRRVVLCNELVEFQLI